METYLHDRRRSLNGERRPSVFAWSESSTEEYVDEAKLDSPPEDMSSAASRRRRDSTSSIWDLTRSLHASKEPTIHSTNNVVLRTMRRGIIRNGDGKGDELSASGMGFGAEGVEVRLVVASIQTLTILSVTDSTSGRKSNYYSSEHLAQQH